MLHPHGSWDGLGSPLGFETYSYRSSIRDATCWDGLGSPLGFETQSYYYCKAYQNCWDGLGSPLGFETITRFFVMVPVLRWDGLGSPFGFETQRNTTVALVLDEEELNRLGPPNSARLLQVGVQCGSRLLESRDGQALRPAQMDIVGVIANLAMPTPDSSRDVVEFPMCRQAS